ncbi:tyrosine-protein kinase receptor torso isoform X2 [Anoplophora glabripennis]|uniref:tyrosine-protein kinase receptor torso isoform X2 n=1 Tax=Anoplophora glabripennis TaxID=217634 RepID=UPI0008745D4C|nr:tyrosine-protein kinase receptor torso isoform X2 [Anoplophora glabripennis]
MILLKLILVCVFMLTSVCCEKNDSNSEELCRFCVEIKNTSCIANVCEYRRTKVSAFSGKTRQADDDVLPPPEMHCQNEGLMVFVWHAKNDTSYFLEYSISETDRNFTEVTTEGFQILEDLQPDTNYVIQLTSVVTDNFVVHLRRSPIVSIRTLRQGRTPLPVKKVYLDSFKLIDDTYTALVKWEQGADRACFYYIMWYGGDELGDVKQRDIEDPLAAPKINITDLQFGNNYSLSIRAVREDYNVRSESLEKWLIIEVPTCLQTFHSLSNCVPEIPENFEVEEVIHVRNHVGFPRYDVKMSWSEPSYKPDYYTAVIFNTINNGSLKINITGNETSAEFTNIELDTYYQVSLAAHSVKGSSPEATIYRFVNSTAVLLTSESWMSTEIILLIVSPFVIIGLILLLLFNHFLVKKQQRNYFKEIEEKNVPTVNYIQTRTNTLEQADEWELLSEKILTKEVLGEGAFGIVRKGEYYAENGNSIEVAIKMLKDNPSQEELRQFCQEIDIMKSVPSHPHLVSLIGCITQGTNQGPLLVVEYCSKGDLQTYLRSAWNKLTNGINKDKINLPNLLEYTKCASNKLYDLNVEQYMDIPQPKDLVSYARQIALGMEYLSSLKLIHRDLAARNVLICKDNTVKISDFGLSRDVYHNKIYCKTTGGKLPLRWMALESMTHQVYTTRSDVWSFGILLWEIITLGSTPYPGISTGDLLPLLKSGYRMEKPSNCSNELYTIMCKCWKAAPRERPTFSELRKTLDELLESVSNYLNLNTSESGDIYISRKNKMNKYKNVNFSEGYVIQMKGV